MFRFRNFPQGIEIKIHYLAVALPRRVLTALSMFIPTVDVKKNVSVYRSIDESI